ncbi:MAG TPA: hypothetical protein VMW36_05110 [Patescibacteria group bacterium]|nr:hypothetical protein [Patescibacteria group bacterium]
MGKVSCVAAKVGLGLLLVTAEPLTIMLVSCIPRFRTLDKHYVSEHGEAYAQDARLKKREVQVFW